MQIAAGETTMVETWGPVRSGFSVSFPDGERGRVEHIRVGAGAVELLVATGLFVRRLVTVAGDDIEAILPHARRVIVDSPYPQAEDMTGLDAAGGIVRMPARRSSRLDAPPEDAA